MEWKRLIREAAFPFLGECSQVPNTSSFSVCLLFCVPSNGRGLDLDNLAKPVLDTLFTIPNRQVTGALFGTNDSNVVRLVLEKRQPSCSDEPEHMVVTIEWDLLD